MNTVTIELHEDVAAALRERAAALGVQPEELARDAVVDLLRDDDAAFLAAADHVLDKNHELYSRLA